MQTEITDDFDLTKIAKSGQCFRVREFDDGRFRFISKDHVLYLKKTGETTYDLSCSKEAWQNFWSGYFDLGRNYKKIRRESRGKNSFADAAMDAGEGIRILRQDPFETPITFLISQRKNIPAIQKAVQDVCQAYGQKITTDCETLYTFPTPENLSSATETDLRELRLGYRAPYVLDAVRRVETHELDLTALTALSSSELLDSLQSVKGVGPKVASCVALFSYGRCDCVPVDVWIHRAIEEDCNGCSPFPLYGEDAGILQQYIFYYERLQKGTEYF